MLAAQLIKAQGVEVVAMYFYIPFSSRRQGEIYGCPEAVRKAADYLGVELIIEDISDDFLSVLGNPIYGYGSNINPCIDCRILMLRKAKEALVRLNCGFLVTGEVVGQRSMSQQRTTLRTIEKKADLEGFVVRPLSARLLEETVPEKEGWIKREKLLDFNGRSRRPQIKLAEDFGFTEFANPAGGCLLTDPQFARRVRDLIEYKEINKSNIELLKVGRHFRLSDKAKLIVGRNEKENEELLGLAVSGDYLFTPPEEIAGATALGRGVFDEERIKLSSSILSRYFDLSGIKSADVMFRAFPHPEQKSISVEVFSDRQISNFRI